MIDKNKMIKVDWSQVKANYNETVMDTNDYYFTAELPDDNRKLYLDRETVCVDGSV